MIKPARRIITGMDEQGRSCVVLDGPLQPSDGQISIAWRTDSVPADNSGVGDCPAEPYSFEMMQSGGTVFLLGEYPPGAGSGEAFWHATDTIDYIIILSGEIVLMLDTGEVRAKAGDVIVQRGIIHAWRNDTDQPVRTAIVNIPALPVGNGRTV